MVDRRAPSRVVGSRSCELTKSSSATISRMCDEVLAFAGPLRNGADFVLVAQNADVPEGYGSRLRYHWSGRATQCEAHRGERHASHCKSNVRECHGSVPLLEILMTI